MAVQVAKVRQVSVREVLRKCRANLARVYRIPEARVRKQSVAIVGDIHEEKDNENVTNQTRNN